MKKSLYSKILSLLFICSLLVPLSLTLGSCSSSKKGKYNKPRNGGRKINSSGHVGNRKSKNSHVWGK